MAPEQCTGDPFIDHRADIDSFGVVAYELLAGRRPFSDRDLRQGFAQLTERPSDVRKLRPDTPAGLATLVMKCLEARPDARAQRMTEVIFHLESNQSSPLGLRGLFEMMGLRLRKG